MTRTREILGWVAEFRAEPPAAAFFGLAALLAVALPLLGLYWLANGLFGVGDVW